MCINTLLHHCVLMVVLRVSWVTQVSWATQVSWVIQVVWVTGNNNNKPYHQFNIHAIEMVQRYAAQYVLNKFDRYGSVSDMISILGWSTLESRRNTLRILTM